MKLRILPLTALALTLSLSSCKKSTDLDEYKYANNKEVLTCQINEDDNKLLNEAIYSFESDIKAKYSNNNPLVSRSYSVFIKDITYKRINYKEIATPHSIKIAKALKASKFYKDGFIDFNGDLMNCILDKIKSKSLKETFVALKETNSLRPNVVLPLLYTNVRDFETDKSIGAFVAFEYYYNSLMLLDEKDLLPKVKKVASPINFNNVPRTVKTPQPVEIKKTPAKGHEGHNH